MRSKGYNPKVMEHDLRLVLRLAKRVGALEVRVGGMTIVLARDAGKRSAQAAPTRRSPAAVPPRAPQSARPARTARPEEPEAEAPSMSPNSRHRWSANRLLVFQERKCREEARGLSLTRILCRPAMQRLQESCFDASCFVRLRAPTALRRLRWTQRSWTWRRVLVLRSHGS